MAIKKFAKVMTIADKYGDKKDLAKYTDFYNDFIEEVKKDTTPYDIDMSIEDFQTINQMKLVTLRSEKLWYDVHNPCYKITNEVANKIKDVVLPKRIDPSLLPFDSYLVIFPKKTYKTYKSNNEIINIDGIMVSRFYNFINVVYYVSDKKGSTSFSDVINTFNDYDMQTKDIGKTEIERQANNTYKKATDIALKIGFISSNEILTDSGEKVFISKQSKKDNNTTIITDFKCSDYRRYLKPVWDNMTSNVSNITKELHYQFTRKGHWRRLRDKITGKVTRKVWIKNALIRPDLPRKVELLMA